MTLNDTEKTKLKQLCENKLKAAQLKIEKIEIMPNDEIKSSDFIIPEE